MIRKNLRRIFLKVLPLTYIRYKRKYISPLVYIYNFRLGLKVHQKRNRISPFFVVGGKEIRNCLLSKVINFIKFSYFSLFFWENRGREINGSRGERKVRRKGVEKVLIPRNERTNGIEQENTRGFLLMKQHIPWLGFAQTVFFWFFWIAISSAESAPFNFNIFLP